MTGPLFDEKIIDKNANDLTLNFLKMEKGNWSRDFRLWYCER